jgi:hypothetical protein
VNHNGGDTNLWFHTVAQTGKLLATDHGTEMVDAGAYNLMTRSSFGRPNILCSLF